MINDTNLMRRIVTVAALATGLFTFAGAAQAQQVTSMTFEVRTGGDNLRGGNDNAFVVIFTDNGAVLRQQLNARNRELKDYTTARQTVRLPAGTDLSNIQGFGLLVRGFTGGFDGDNWNVDGLRITARLADGRGYVMMNESASPLYRFTGDNKSFTRNIR